MDDESRSMLKEVADEIQVALQQEDVASNRTPDDVRQTQRCRFRIRIVSPNALRSRQSNGRRTGTDGNLISGRITLRRCGSA